MMRNFIIFSVVILSLTGCYKFKSPPFADKDLKLISATEFGKDVFKAISKIGPEKGSPIGELKGSFSDDSKALVINDEFLVMQKIEKRAIKYCNGENLSTSETMRCFDVISDVINDKKQNQIIREMSNMFLMR